MQKIIEVHSLSKSYGNIKAVDNIDFYVEQGQLFAFLGPNGAGKSTTIDIICTLLKPDGGTAVVDGHTLGKNDDQIRSSIGAVFQDGLLDPLLTVKENLYIRSGFYDGSGLERKKAVDYAVSAAGVGEYADRAYGKLSGGQKRRADIARSLVNKPKILFLDEPTTGLDPQTRQNVWDSVKKLRDETQLTLFLTTHYMDEAASADYVVIIDNGRIAASGTPDKLRDAYAGDFLKVTPNSPALENILAQNKIDYVKSGERLTISLKRTKDALPILRLIEAHIESFEVINGTMDDAFIAITGKDIRE